MRSMSLEGHQLWGDAISVMVMAQTPKRLYEGLWTKDHILGKVVCNF